jgi:hypothetical protein
MQYYVCLFFSLLEIRHTQYFILNTEIVMTKSRISSTRVLLGVLGKSSKSSEILREWNRFLREQGIDGSMDRYPCTAITLPERLSEMLHFDRRGYIVAESLQKIMKDFMDRLDSSSREHNAVDTIVNDRGIFTGYWTNNDDMCRKDLWLHVNSPRRCQMHPGL